MTDLSPTAQTVLDAAVAVNDFVCTDSVAATLRAAVAAVEFPPRHDADPLWNAGFDYAQKAVLGDLLAIADELEQ